MDYETLLAKYAYAELRIERSTDVSMRITNDEIKRTSGEECGVSVRVLENGSWGLASSNGEATSKLVSDLLIQAHKLASLSKGKIKLNEMKPNHARVKSKAKETNEDVILSSLLSVMKNLNQNKNEKIISKTVSCSDTRDVIEFYNSEGSDIIQEASHTYFGCTCIAKEGENIQRASERRATLTGFGSIDLEIANEARERAIRLLKAQAPPKGRFSAVFDPEMTGVFSHEAVGHACEADAIIDKESILRGKIGKKIGNSLVSIADDPTADGYGGYSFDDEGVKAVRTPLIEKGILKGYMNSRETACALDHKPNGHARAEGYASVPVVRMSNTHFARGKDSHADVFDIKYGVYLKGMKGGSVDTFSGGFMFKAEEAFLIEKGEVTKTLRDVTITGNVLETMLSVQSVGKDFGTSPGYCGKAGQSVPVSDGGPHIRVKNVTIG